MKVFYLFIFVFAGYSVWGQEDYASSKRAQSFFFEAGGIGLPLSFNYETRLPARAQNGLGLRVGVGGIKDDWMTIFSVPLQVNWLLGKNKNYFEVGAGATFFHYDEEGDGYYEDYVCNAQGCVPSGKKFAGHFLLPLNNKNSIMGTLNFGYRRQPLDNGFMWKVAVTPVFNSNGFWPLYGGISFGYKF